jgi:hypothetical protein
VAASGAERKMGLSGTAGLVTTGAAAQLVLPELFQDRTSFTSVFKLWNVDRLLALHDGDADNENSLGSYFSL